MKQPSIYLKMKVLGAIDVAPGKTRHERTHNVAAMTFLDEQGQPRQFTWRTIQTWYYRYKNYGITSMNNHARTDKGKPRKVTPEEVLEAINQALPHFRQKTTPNTTAIYRFCVTDLALIVEPAAFRPNCCRSWNFLLHRQFGQPAAPPQLATRLRSPPLFSNYRNPPPPRPFF